MNNIHECDFCDSKLVLGILDPDVPDFISPACLPEFSLSRTLNSAELSIREKVSVFTAFESPDSEKESLSRGGDKRKGVCRPSSPPDQPARGGPVCFRLGRPFTTRERLQTVICERRIAPLSTKIVAVFLL